MLTRRARGSSAIVAAGVLASISGAAAQPLDRASDRECHTLSCTKCASLCRATCDADAVACDAKHKRGCPSAYRACQRGCTSELCAQCMPIQYDGKNRKFMPGKIELCRTPGHNE